MLHLVVFPKKKVVEKKHTPPQKKKTMSTKHPKVVFGILGLDGVSVQ
jgi:hypothetical protein